MSNPSEGTRLTGILEKIAFGALSFFLVMQWNDQGKLEDKVERLQASSFTTENARILEDRLTKGMDAIRADVNNKVEGLRSDMNSKLDLLIKMQTETPSRR
jgi:hypothetical protein